MKNDNCRIKTFDPTLNKLNNLQKQEEEDLPTGRKIIEINANDLVNKEDFYRK
jgi:hypothetical protein